MSHFIVTIYSFKCDVESCRNQVAEQADNLVVARQQLRRRGWFSKASGDYCPEHKDLGE